MFFYGWPILPASGRVGLLSFRSGLSSRQRRGRISRADEGSLFDCGPGKKSTAKSDPSSRKALLWITAKGEWMVNHRSAKKRMRLYRDGGEITATFAGFRQAAAPFLAVIQSGAKDLSSIDPRATRVNSSPATQNQNPHPSKTGKDGAPGNSNAAIGAAAPAAAELTSGSRSS
jgi:hypothetical protein